MFKFREIISTLNFVLCFIGYALVTSLFLPISLDIEGVSQKVTIPYRAFCVIVSLLTIALTSKSSCRITDLMKCLFFFWILLLIRVFIDFEIRTDIYIFSSEKMKVWLYVIAICFLTMYSVYKSIYNINIDKAFYLIYYGLCLVMLLQLVSNSALTIAAYELQSRVKGSEAMNSISFGHYSLMMIIFSISYFFRSSFILQKIVAILSMFIGLFLMLRSGSRGPLLSLCIVVLLLIYSKQINRINSVIILFFALILIFIFSDIFLDFIYNISPVMHDRILLSLAGDTNGRDQLYDTAFDMFINSPILGEQFLLVKEGRAYYSHNFILDAFMGLGTFGGLLFCYLLYQCFSLSCKNIPKQIGNEWIFLVLIQQIMFNMTSSAFYYNQLLSVLMAFVFLNYSKNNLTNL